MRLEDYIRIPDTNVVIAREGSHEDFNWEDTHYSLAEDGLFMPPPSLFMPYLKSIKLAAKGKLNLYDGNNKPILINDINRLCNHILCTYTGKVAWLDARFLHNGSGSGFGSLDIETDHKIVLEKGKKKLIGVKMPLEQIVNKDNYLSLNCYVDFDFNGQGLPISKSHNQERTRDHMLFWYPHFDKVASFSAYATGSEFSCDQNPNDTRLKTHVYACAKILTQE